MAAGGNRSRTDRRCRPDRCPAPDSDPARRAGILAVAILVAVLTWNDLRASLVLIQKPEAFVPPTLSRFSTFYSTHQRLTFAGMAIAILPPLLLSLAPNETSSRV